MEVKGRTALITGGAHGIGLACAAELLRHGAQVSICDVDAPRGRGALQHLRSEFGPRRVIFVKADVTDAEEFEGAFKETVATFKSLDIVLNNAGVITSRDWDKMIDINLRAVVVGTELAFKYMGSGGAGGGAGGVLVNTASIAGLVPVPSMPVYVATKWAVVGLSRSYGTALHMGRTGVRVLAICPGVTDTALFDAVVAGGDDTASLVSEGLSKVTNQRPENVAAGVLTMIKVGENGSVWLCQDNSPAFEVNFPGIEPKAK